MNLDAVDVTVFLDVGESPVARWGFRSLVGVTSGVVCGEPFPGCRTAFGPRSSEFEEMPNALAAAVLPPSQPARPPVELELSALPGLPSPVNGISSANLGVLLVGDGVLLPSMRGSRFGKDCCRRWWDGREGLNPMSTSEKPLWYSSRGRRDGSCSGRRAGRAVWAVRWRDGRVPDGGRCGCGCCGGTRRSPSSRGDNAGWPWSEIWVEDPRRPPWACADGGQGTASGWAGKASTLLLSMMF